MGKHIRLSIASGGTTTEVFGINGMRLAGVLLNEALTGATCSFLGGVDADGGDGEAVSDSEGNAVTFACTAAGFIGFSGAEADALAAAPKLQIVADAQADDRVITAVFV